MARETDLRVPVRSHHADFVFERRIYSIPLDREGGRAISLGPSGVLVRGIIYWAAALAALIVLRSLPLTSLVLGQIPLAVLVLICPTVIAVPLTMVRPGGRVFHVAIRALTTHAFTPRTLHGFRSARRPQRRWEPTPIVMLASGAEHTCRQLRFTGPGRLWIGRPHAQQLNRRGLPKTSGADVTLTELDRDAATGTGRYITLKPGRTVQTRRARGRS